MAETTNAIGILRDACQLAGCSWAALVERVPDGWTLSAAHGMGSADRTRLIDALGRPPLAAWLAGALETGKPRSRKSPAGFMPAAASLLAVPIPDGARVAISGAEAIDARSRRIWALAVPGLAGDKMVLPGLEQQLGQMLLPDARDENPYDVTKALGRMLAGVMRSTESQGAWLAIHSGDTLSVVAQSGAPSILGMSLQLEGNPILRHLVRERTALRVERGKLAWSDVPRKGLKDSTKFWALIPLVIGQRLIGAIALWGADRLPAPVWEQVLRFAGHVAPSVDLLITFDEVTGHLRRLALLNDFALTISSAQSLEQIVRRLFALLARAFRAEWATMFLLSSDQRSLRTYQAPGGRGDVRNAPLERSPQGRMVADGRLLRSGILPAGGYVPVHSAAQSALFVPLRYRGRVIGAIALESEAVDVFDVYDEHLMVVISSHLAGLVEYSRLREEAESRARTLGLIHEVVQQVIGLTNTAEVAQITADLLAQYFAFDLTAVALVDPNGEFAIRAFGGPQAEVVERALRENAEQLDGQGITWKVFSSGESLLANDVSQEPAYLPIPGWAAGSEMCVPLRAGERVLGIIDIENARRDAFTASDLLAIESLAGILAGVVSSADQYQRLQVTNRELRVIQQELQTRIEAQRAAENRLVQAAKLAAVGEMAAGIAHELNNPLTTVTGFTELVLGELEAEAPQRADLELVLREANRARDVVRRMLDFARQTESVRASADLNEVVTDVVALVRHLLHTNGVDLQLDLAGDMPWISMDRNQMKQVLLNLIHNALQAMPAGGELFLSTSKGDRDGRQWLIIVIRDTGIGISYEDRERIFEPFFTTRGDSGGTGLGLSVTYGIITDHGGRIDVESEPGAGSTFRVWLPV